MKTRSYQCERTIRLEKLNQIPTQEIALIMHQEGHHQAPICA